MFSDCNILGVFHILNVCMAFTLVSHSVVCAWRGTWTLIDLYILPSDITVSSAVTAVVGVLILGTGNSLKALCKKYIAPGCTVQFLVVSRLLHYCLILGTVFTWRGVWYLEDLAMDRGWKSNTICFFVFFVVMCLLRISVDCVTPPLFMMFDQCPEVFESVGRFGVKASKHPVLFVLDQFITKLVLESLVVSVWRGFWNIQNAVLLPDDPLASHLVSWGGGNALCLLLVVLEKPLTTLSEKAGQRNIVLKLLVEDLYVLFAIVGVVAMWRGFWNILETDVLPDPLVGGWTCHVVGILCLLLTGTLPCGYAPTCIIDGGPREDVHTFWFFKYFQVIFQNRVQNYEISRTDIDKTEVKDKIKEVKSYGIDTKESTP